MTISSLTTYKMYLINREFAFIHPHLTQHLMCYLSFQLLSLCFTGCLAPFLELVVRILSLSGNLKEVLFSKRKYTYIMVVVSILETGLLH